jgi:hypothetical protein
MFQPEQIELLNKGDAISMEAHPAPAPELASQMEAGLRPPPSGLGPAAASGPRVPKSSNKTGKKKAAMPSTVRNWLKIDQNGETSMVQADKYKLTHKLGVQGRDLRIMDPSLATTYPSAILCRDRALVVNLEHIKVVITTNSVLVVNPEDENVLPFISELKMKVSQPGLGLGVSASYPAALVELGPGGGPGGEGGGGAKAGGGLSNRSVASHSNVKLEGLAALQMPFELKALEVCLDSVSGAAQRGSGRGGGMGMPAACFSTARPGQRMHRFAGGDVMLGAAACVEPVHGNAKWGSCIHACTMDEVSAPSLLPQLLLMYARLRHDNVLVVQLLTPTLPCPTPGCLPRHTLFASPQPPAQIASYLNRLTSDLEAAAYPALDSLTNRVTAHNLERVRRIKGRLVRLTTRVETVRGLGLPGVQAGARLAPVLALAPNIALRWLHATSAPSCPSLRLLWACVVFMKLPCQFPTCHLCTSMFSPCYSLAWLHSITSRSVRCWRATWTMTKTCAT